ncbi:MAG: hypothetical protein Pg6A_11730 [Termitinemataceae bacterium]|jgi:hypothetical protein|nr:MAG: hypothetical protein Pg6A_11730 [Termitinemataceae bacterium]
MRDTEIIRKEGMDCLLNTLGVLETEVFISSLLRERFDYTEWQREYFAGWKMDDFLSRAVEYDKRNPFVKHETEKGK